MLHRDIHKILYYYAYNQPNYLLYVCLNNIIHYKDIYIDWYTLCNYKPLKIEFIDCFFNKIKWNIISKYFHLEEKILYRYFDKLNWKYICMYQKLSKSFIYDNLDLIDIHSLSLNKNYSENDIKFILNTIETDKKLYKILSNKRYKKKILYSFFLK